MKKKDPGNLFKMGYQVLVAGFATKSTNCAPRPVPCTK
jgi:hypothetical protein